jgi:predicted nucleotidyltransferase
VVGRIARRIGLSPRFLYHEDVRAQLLTDSRLRGALGSADVLYGTLDLSFPDRSQHRRGGGRVLGRINPDLRLPSRRALSSLKRVHGVRRLRVFGSAVRSDFRRDSDVDVAVRLAPGITRRAEVRASLEEELERLLRRDVDVVLEETLKPSVREVVEREGVAL